MSRTRLLALLLLIASVYACSRVPITGRRQSHLLPESELIGMSLTEYQAFLDQSNVLPLTDPRTVQVQKVGNKIKDAVEAYLEKEGNGKRVEGFQWEFNVVDDPTINAWCMPGGKVVFYTGILDVTQDEDGLAVVMGHEIAHAIARHGNERMTQQIALNAAGMTLSAMLSQKSEMAQGLFAQAFGLGGSLGILAFSRKHETESDKMGLAFMAMAGYQPQAAPKFWERMAATGGGAPPEFLSTHPSHETRINDLNAFMPEAMKYYTGN